MTAHWNSQNSSRNSPQTGTANNVSLTGFHPFIDHPSRRRVTHVLPHAGVSLATLHGAGAITKPTASRGRLA
jgi:hypothetical protein